MTEDTFGAWPPLHPSFSTIVSRRVHITEETLEHLNGAYQVEDGDGGSRDPLLKGRKTFLVIDPQKPDSMSRKPKLVCMLSIINFF